MGYQVYEDAAARGLGYRCGDDTDAGCGLSFCSSHLLIGGDDPQMCERCCDEEPPFDPKPDTAEWEAWMLTDDSWGGWRVEHPALTAEMKARARARVVEDEGSVHWRGAAVCIACDWRGMSRLYPKVARRDAEEHNRTEHLNRDQDDIEASIAGDTPWDREHAQDHLNGGER